MTFSAVTDNGDGSYTATLTGTTAGAAAVSATLGGAAFGVAPAGVTLTAGAPDAARSSLAAAPATIAADGVATSKLTLTLRDALNNPVSGQAVAFASTLGGVTFSTVTDNGDGSYTATLTGTTAGAAAVSATLGGAAFGVAPAGVTLTGEITGVTAGGFTFATTAGFPTTGFNNASFTINIRSANEYDWASSAPWASVDDSGRVEFISNGNASPVTITATPKLGGSALTYTFTIKSWFLGSGDTEMLWSDVAAYCSARSGYSMPTAQQLIGNGTRGTLGGLWSEWGAIRYYGTSEFFHNFYWVSDPASSGFNNTANITVGYVGIPSPTRAMGHTACRKDL
ncbi:Ig-like domain-containing protein [Enterobacter sp. 18A13]|uniref:Ig-like domain-containing protein n=1 Tax=Enterobacter sp. 18A13 TaxID=2565914 RepID=UPI0010CA4EDC|nr:Ig-like domain-containing protein [Enterobacter sp. 18A13]BBJ69892.1 hypothetical protein ECC18A13_p11340 [Enterobacter sp. 18A13]